MAKSKAMRANIAHTFCNVIINTQHKTEALTKTMTGYI